MRVLKKVKEPELKKTWREHIVEQKIWLILIGLLVLFEVFWWGMEIYKTKAPEDIKTLASKYKKLESAVVYKGWSKKTGLESLVRIKSYYDREINYVQGKVIFLSPEGFAYEGGAFEFDKEVSLKTDDLLDIKMEIKNTKENYELLKEIGSNDAVEAQVYVFKVGFVKPLELKK